MGDIYQPVVKYRVSAVRSVFSTLFDRRQLCGLLLSVVQQLVCCCHMCNSIGESLAALNREKSTVMHPNVVSDLPVSNVRSQSTSTHRTDMGRVVNKESTLKPLNTASSSNLDSSVQSIVEKMHSGLEVCCACQSTLG